MSYPDLSPADEHQLAGMLDRLHQAQQASGMSQKELERRTGVGQSTISLWFNTKARRTRQTGPLMLQVVKVAGVLGVNLHWLATGQGGMFAPAGDPQRDQAQGGLDAISQVDQFLRQLRRELEASLERRPEPTPERVAAARTQLTAPVPPAPRMSRRAR